MAKHSEFVVHLLDLLHPLGDVTARSMFGGWGFYHQGKMFALVATDTFYVKVDPLTRDEFESHGLTPFSYETQKGRREVMSYFTVPSEALEVASALCDWARKGIAAATRAGKSPPKKSPKTIHLNAAATKPKTRRNPPHPQK